MASNAVMTAVKARLAGGWTNCPVPDINTVGETPADGSAFLTVQYPVSTEEHVGLGQVGQRVFREEGAIRFVLSVPRGQGIDQATQWADQLRVLFRAAEFSGVTCEAASPAAFDDSNDNGDYFILRVIVPYFYDLAA